MKQVARFLAIAILCGAALAAHAQTEIAVTGGGDFVSTQSVSVDRTWAIEGSIAHKIFGVPLIGLYGEVPIAAGFSSTPRLNTTFLRQNYSSLFVTPGVKLRISGPGIAPYFVMGGGFAHFKASGGGGSTTTGAVSYGGGVDFTLLPLIGLRGEVRDYNSGFGLTGISGSGRQHNLFVTGGLVLRF